MVQTAGNSRGNGENLYYGLFHDTPLTRVPLGLFRATPAGQIVHANPALVDMLGYPGLDSLLKANASDLYLESCARPCLQTLAEGAEGPRSYEIQLRRYDGAALWVRQTCRAVRDGDGAVAYYEARVEDLIQRKRAEEALQDAYLELETRVGERTRDLVESNTRLRREVAERKRAEEALRESEERFRAQYRGSPIPTFTWRGVGDDFILTDYNDAAGALTQGRASSLVGSAASGLFQDIPGVVEDLAECFATRAVVKRGRVMCLRSTGEEKSLALTYAYVPPDLVLVHAEDVSERKQAEAEVKRRARQVEALHQMSTALIQPMEMKSVAALALNLALKVLALDGGAIRYLDEASQDLVLLGHRGLPPDLAREMEQRPRVKVGQGRAGRVAQRGRPLILEDASLDTEETFYPASRGPAVGAYVGLPLKVQGKVVGVLSGVCSRPRVFGMTEMGVMGGLGNMVGMVIQRAREEEALRESEEKYRTLVESASDAIMVADQETGIILEANQSAADLLGLPVEEIVGMHYLDVYPPERREDYARGFRATSRAGRRRGELLVRHRSGRVVPVEVSASSTQLNGRPVLVGIFRDVSERKRAEADIKERTRQISALHAMSTALSQPMGLAEVAGLGLELAMAVLDLDGGDIRYVDEATQELVPLSQCGFSPKLARELEARPRIKVGKGWSGLVAQSGEALVIEDTLHYPVAPFYPASRDPAIRSFVALPLKARGRVVGTIAGICSQPRTFEKAEIALMGDLGNMVGMAIERAREEQALRESEEKYRRLFETSPIGITTLNMKGVITSCNPAVYREGGYSEEDLVGKHFTKLAAIRLTEIPKFMRLFASLIRGKVSAPFEMAYHRKDGSTGWTDIHVAVLESGGRKLGFQILQRDISEHKRAEAALRESEERFRGIFEESPIGIEIYDAGGRLIHANRACLDIFGITRLEEVKGFQLFEDPNVPEAVRSALRAGEAARYEVAFDFDKVRQLRLYETTRSGVANLDVSINPLGRRGGGDMWGYLVQVQDITEREETVAALVAERYFLESVFASIQDGVSVVDRDLTIIDVNPTLERLYSHAAPLVGKKCYQAYHGREEPCEHCCTLQALETGKPAAMVRPREDGRGEVFGWAEVFSFPWVDPATGQVIGAIEYARDISERRRSEEELRAYQERLRSLASALLLAEERERHTIATGLHDSVGQDLVVSRMKLQALEQSAPAGMTRALGEIRELVEQALEETRLLTFQLSPPVLYALGLEAALEWLGEDVMRRHEIPVLVEDDGQPKPLDEATRVLLFRATRELLYNVIKHAQASQVVVSVSREDDKIRIDVEDNGVGIDVSKASVHTGGARGFGLFNIRERLANIGGRLDLASEPGGGTRATLVAPLRRDE